VKNFLHPILHFFVFIPHFNGVYMLNPLHFPADNWMPQTYASCRTYAYIPFETKTALPYRQSRLFCAYFLIITFCRSRNPESCA
jgi:hypothetical protein